MSSLDSDIDPRSNYTGVSTRAATLVGLLAAAVGVAWIHEFGTGSATVLMLAGVAVGVVYSRRPYPAHRAGLRTGLIAAVPEVVAQVFPDIATLSGTSIRLTVPIWLATVVTVLFAPAVWLIFASVCVLTAAASGWIAARSRAVVLGLIRSDGL